MNGSVPTNVASLKLGGVTRRTTAGITRMKMFTTVPAGSASQAILSVPITTASLRAGSAMWTMTVETTQMSRCPNAVSSCGRDMHDQEQETKRPLLRPHGTVPVGSPCEFWHYKSKVWLAGWIRPSFQSGWFLLSRPRTSNYPECFVNLALSHLSLWQHCEVGNVNVTNSHFTDEETDVHIKWAITFLFRGRADTQVSFCFEPGPSLPQSPIVIL